MSVPILVHELRICFGDVVAVDGATFEVAPGELFVLLGASGSGKTTTLRAIGGFERPEVGTVTLGEETVCGPGVWVPPERRQVGFVFQDYALFPHLSVVENIGFGLRDRGARDRRVTELMELMELTDLGHRRPHELSGGQQQRVALARAVAPRPPVLLLDEPFGHLDATLRHTLRARTIELLRGEGATLVWVTHDQEEALAVADRLAVMRDGRVEQVGPPEHLYACPANRFVADFLGRTNLLRGEAKGTTAQTFLGEVSLAEPANGAVDLSIRPHQLTLSSGGAGVVLQRAFLGPAVRYVVRAGGQDLEVFVNAADGETGRLKVGDPVSVAVTTAAQAAVLGATSIPTEDHES